jgi:hypothetical protein
MLPPLGAVVGGVAMLALAVGAPDPLVVDDYARIEDLAREELAADRRAAELGLRATATFSLDDDGRAAIAVELASDGPFVAPRELDLKLRHAARAEADRAMQLGGDGITYSGKIDLAGGRYAVELSAPDGDWRLAGSVARVPAAIELSPAGTADE